MEKRNWKATLLMPKTDFEMRANLKEKEVLFRELWEKNDLYNEVLKKNFNNKPFVLHDGPPYANGDLHLGHALNKILKDIIVRYKNMKGFYSPFVLGWDTHGLPVENKVLEKLKMSKDDINKIALRKEAAIYAKEQVAIQKEQFKKMNLLTDFNKFYLTLDKNYEVAQLQLFKKMVMEGYVYKGIKPIYWSPSSQTALAEAEVEYHDHVSPQIIVGFNVVTGNKKIKKDDKLLIMTTTPWTLIANSAVAVGDNISYLRLKIKNNFFIIAKNLLDDLSKQLKWDHYEIVDSFLGNEIIGIMYQRPIKKTFISPVILGHHVLDDNGTGLVHIAPLFGEDDYIIGKKEKLDMIMHVDKKGNFNSEADEYKNMFYLEANKLIGQFLDKNHDLLSLKFVKHSYPHDWRTHKPVIYRGVPQWFVSIEKIKKSAIEKLSKIHSYPNWGIEKLSKMIEERQDWTISRQRTWGVPIIIFYDREKNPVFSEDIFDYVIDLVSKHGTDIWWEKTADELLPKKYRGLNYTKEMDIMDVWFDSGSSNIALQIPHFNGVFDVYLEGSDQYRGWFNSSLINSMIYYNRLPFKELVSHGFVLDKKQQKMSKSKGNIISPLEIINKNGAEVLRLWVANSEFSNDITISNEIVKQNIEIYRRIRNSIKFMLGNLFDFNESKKIPLTGIHSLIDERLNNLVYDVIKSYDNYNFINIIKTINTFLIDLSSFYFEFSKDILYTEEVNNIDRLSIQTNIFNILNFLLKILAPILPVTCEEAYTHFNKANKKTSIFLEEIQDQEKKSFLEELKWKDFFILKKEVYKKFEEAKKNKVIKRTNECKLTISQKNPFLTNANLAKLLMVNEVMLGKEIKITTFASEKCQRCWNHFDPKVLNDDICPRCWKVVNKSENISKN